MRLKKSAILDKVQQGYDKAVERCNKGYSQMSPKVQEAWRQHVALHNGKKGLSALDRALIRENTFSFLSLSSRHTQST